MDNQYQQNINTPQSWFKPKYLLYAFIVVVIIEIIWAAKTLLTPIPQKKVTPPPAITDATLSLASASKTYKIGDSVPVNINLSTGGHKTVGTDIVIKYDPKVLEATQTAFIKGAIYPDYPPARINNTKGTVEVSGVVSTKGTGFTGSGFFGKVMFKAKSAGLVLIQIDYTKDLSTDSNVVEVSTSKDVLGGVNNLEVEIK